MPKSRSAIDQLSEAQHQQLIHWLESHSTRRVVEMIALPPPDGFAIQTHITTLRRFYASYKASNPDEEEEIAKLFAQAPASSSLPDATERLLTEWAFQIATNPKRTNAAFKALARWALKNREQTLREEQIEINKQRLSLEREKFEFNAARQALLHHEPLGKIIQQDLDDEAKIHAAREQLFGRSLPVKNSPPNPDSPAPLL